MEKATDNWTRSEARHLMNRAGFGGAPAEIDRLYEMGRRKAVAWMLDFERAPAADLPEWADPVAMAAEREELRKERMQLRKESTDLSREELDKKKTQLRRARVKVEKRRGLEIQAWWFQRMLTTSTPLQEKMTLFWHDHFPTSMQKVRMPFLLLEQNLIFRNHAIGDFRKLTHEIAMNPAMMLYLDSNRSSKENPNENFARELMELFTLGEGKYTEQDVKEAARAFTGYQLDRKTGKVELRKRRHDAEEKIIFGKTGNFDGQDVVDLIFERNESADYIAGKIWAYFTGKEASAEIVTELGTFFKKNNFVIEPLLEKIFLSKEFYETAVMGAQIKSPVQFMVQMLKELEMEDAPKFFPLMGQAQLGQVLFLPPNVAGWDWEKAWINTNTLLTRYNLAGYVTKGGQKVNDKQRLLMKVFRRRLDRDGLEGKSKPNFKVLAKMDQRRNVDGLVAAWSDRFFSIDIPEKASESFRAYAQTKAADSFTDAEAGELCHLMMSTPYYQLC